ncbi:MAG TPA: short-chain dehydrogenase, partial [Acinetobacter junii]|nr:short-chain dehydrogenase [Acinetobacter junii]
HMRMLDTDKAAGWLVKAVQKKPYRVTSPSGAIANALLNTAPSAVMNLTRPLFRLMDRQLEKKL